MLRWCQEYAGKKVCCYHSNLQRAAESPLYTLPLPLFKLSIKDVTRSSRLLSDVMDSAGEISVLIKFSPKHEKFLENLKEQFKNSEQITPNKITKLYTTRWTVRASALLKIPIS